MELRITTFYALCREPLSAPSIREDRQVKMNNAEVMTVVLTAARFFGGNFRTAARFPEEHGYIPDMPSESGLNRGIHALDGDIWGTPFTVVSETFKNRNIGKEYILDSFPVPICGNIRISRSKIFQGEEFRGYMPSKRRCFYGIRVHMIVTASGEPVGFLIAPGSVSDLTVLKQPDFSLPPGSTCYADKIYNDHSFEDLLSEAAGIMLKPTRKKNSVRAGGDFIFRRALASARKRTETSFSGITGLFPKKIHAVTPQGFALKVIGFIIQFASENYGLQSKTFSI